MASCDCGKWPARVQRLPDGVGMGGVFVIEPWMFAPRAAPGSAWPPALRGAEWARLFGDVCWRSEAHLTRLLVERVGAAACLASFREHWSLYLHPRAALGTLRGHGIRRLRIPVPWQMFAPREEGFTFEGGFVADPFAHEEAAFVLCPPDQFLTPWLRAAAEEGSQVLLDLHTLPGQTGPAYRALSWPLAVGCMAQPAQRRWLRAYVAILERCVAYVRELPPALRRAVVGIMPSQSGMQMDAEAYAVPSYPGEHSVALICTHMYDAALPLILSLRTQTFDMPAIYAGVDRALSQRQVGEYLRRAARWLLARGVASQCKLKRARHLYALNWHAPFVFPSPENIARSIQKIFSSPDPQDAALWSDCCCDWASPPPRSEIFTHRAQEVSMPLDRWKVLLFRALVDTFKQLGVENYYWCWDLPDACSRHPDLPWQHRTFWSLKCVLDAGTDSRAERPP